MELSLELEFPELHQIGVVTDIKQVFLSGAG